MHTFLNLNFVRPAERMELADINEFTHGTIGLGSVELHDSCKANDLHYKFGEITNGELFTCTDINVTIANFTKAWNGTSSACGVVAVNDAICFVTIMNT